MAILTDFNAILLKKKPFQYELGNGFYVIRNTVF